MENNHEERISTLEAARCEIEDSLTVMAHLETRQSNVIKALAERADQTEQESEAHRKRNIETDQRIDRLVSAIGERISRMPPPSSSL